MMRNALLYHPTVCAVGKQYQIMVMTWCDALVSIRVGEKTYFCHSNGIRISAAGVQRFHIPMNELDAARTYTVSCQCVIDRSPYYPTTEETVETEYAFRPLEKTSDIKIYHLADVHGWWDYAVWAAEYHKETYDLLIMNGDIVSASNTVQEMVLCYKIASAITKGEYPCVISRGNHDLRGYRAAELSNYMPSDNGRSYFTFQIGCIWGLLIDTGEDKDDTCPAYGGTICCHQFRLEEDEMIKNVIKNAASEYDAEGVKYKLIISHVPFPLKGNYSTEKELYTGWCNLMKENIKPDLMLCGHTHTASVSAPGSEYDELGQPCTIIVGSAFNDRDKSDVNNVLAGAYIRLDDRKAEVAINTKKQVISKQIVEF